MVTWDSEHVIRKRPGHEERLAWKDLQRVCILTTDEGPFGADFYFVLEGPEGSKLTIAQEEAGALLGRLQELPGFDNESFIRACGSTENALFLCWTAP